MKNPDRWQQRFENYLAALQKYDAAVKEYLNNNNLTDLEQEGIIQRFEYTQELSWKVLSDYLKYQGGNEIITGSRDAYRRAFATGLITDADTWFEMITIRNETSHRYDDEMLDETLKLIAHSFYDCFHQLKNKMEEIIHSENQ